MNRQALLQSIKIRANTAIKQAARAIQDFGD